MFEGILSHYFSTLGVSLSKSFVRYTSGVISSCSFSTHEIARHVSKDTGSDFNTSQKGLHYLLSNDNFQIDDAYWRRHIGMVFDLMEEQEIITPKDTLFLQVDFTTSEDYFLILTASIIVNDRSVPLYFTMRNYPKKKGQYNQKKMELAFLKGLKHVLSKKYAYVIVADRGFGNQRFIEICEDVGFDYLIRVTPNLKIVHENETGIMEKICCEDGVFQVNSPTWHKNICVLRCSNEKGVWHLLSNVKNIDHEMASRLYAERFKIEKCFQDLKSSGFNVEKTKIRKYSNFKRLLAMVMVAHVLLVMLGHMITVKIPSFLKNSVFVGDAILAYFLSEERLIPYLTKENCDH